MVGRSVLVRLVAVALVVATCAIAATAWLTTRSTAVQIQGDVQRSLEVDNQIYEALIDYGAANASWDGAQSLLAQLAADTGRTISVRSTDGKLLLASSDPQETVDDDAGGMLSTARLDPLAPMTVVAVSAPRAVSKDDGMLPAAALHLDADELAMRSKAANDVMACAADLDVSATIIPSMYGGDTVQFEDRPFNQKVYDRCANPLLDEPGRLYTAIWNTVIDRTASCLRTQGFDAEVSGGDSTLRYVTTDVDDAAAVAADEACRSDARRAALQPYIAPPALLYMSSDQRSPSWFDNAGGTRIVLVLIAVLLMTIVLAALGASRILRPIRSLTRATQRMAGGDLGARVRVRGSDEVARLGDAFNAMADSVERNEQQRKLLVSDVAHELRNPLANVRGYLEGAQDDIVRMDAALVDSLLEETLLLQHLIDDLQDLALADAGRLRVHPEPADARALVEQVVAAHRQQAERAGVLLAATGDQTAMLDVDQVRLRQALGNLVSNAMRYTPAGGTIRLDVRTKPGRTNLVAIEVSDTGSGISAEHLPHLFDRFYRADTSRSRDTGGSGLGLAITRHLVEAHGGTIEVASKPGAGTRFTISLPGSPDQPVDPGPGSVRPVTAPPQPVAQSAQPRSPAVQPVTAPPQPVAQSAQPRSPAVQPVTAPPQPVAQSAQPRSPAVQPVTAPVQPVARPDQPLVAPAPPTDVTTSGSDDEPALLTIPEGDPARARQVPVQGGVWPHVHRGTGAAVMGGGLSPE